MKTILGPCFINGASVAKKKLRLLPAAIFCCLLPLFAACLQPLCDLLKLVKTVLSLFRQCRCTKKKKKCGCCLLPIFEKKTFKRSWQQVYSKCSKTEASNKQSQKRAASALNDRQKRTKASSTKKSNKKSGASAK
jgi:hypothetical protein